MPTLSRQFPAVIAIAAVAAFCAACGTSATSNPDSNSAAAGAATAAGAFPVTVSAARGPVRVRSRPARIVSLAHNSRQLTYYYELDQTYYSITSSTFVGSLFKLLGMKSIADGASGAAAAGGYPQLSSEYIIKANPDFIVLADTICCQQSTAIVAKRPGWSGLTAVRDGHIILLNDDIASRWGPRVIDLLRTVEAAVARDRGQ